MEECFDFLDEFVYQINMDPITRPYVIKDKVENSNFLSGIIIIAQSHISIHYDYQKNMLILISSLVQLLIILK